MTIVLISKVAATLRRKFGGDTFAYNEASCEFFRDAQVVVADGVFRDELVLRGIVEQLDTNLYRLTAAYLTGV